jgi:hypothetical protein
MAELIGLGAGGLAAASAAADAAAAAAAAGTTGELPASDAAPELAASAVEASVQSAAAAALAQARARAADHAYRVARSDVPGSYRDPSRALAEHGVLFIPEADPQLAAALLSPAGGMGAWLASRGGNPTIISGGVEQRQLPKMGASAWAQGQSEQVGALIFAAMHAHGLAADSAYRVQNAKVLSCIAPENVKLVHGKPNRVIMDQPPCVLLCGRTALGSLLSARLLTRGPALLLLLLLL